MYNHLFFLSLTAVHHPDERFSTTDPFSITEGNGIVYCKVGCLLMSFKFMMFKDLTDLPLLPISLQVMIYGCTCILPNKVSQILIVLPWSCPKQETDLERIKVPKVHHPFNLAHAG